MTTSAYQHLRRAYDHWRDRGLIALTKAIFQRLTPERFPLHLELSYLEPEEPQVPGGGLRFQSRHARDLAVIATCWGGSHHLMRWIAHTRARYDECPFNLCTVLMEPALREQLAWSAMNIDVQVCQSPQAASELLNATAHDTRADTLIFTSDRTSIQPQALAILRETLCKSASIAAVAARVLRPDGRQRERLVLLDQHGRFDARGIGGDPWQPDDAFLRPVDFAYGDLIAVRRSQFLKIGGFSGGWVTPQFMIADLTLRLHAHRLLTYYQPQAYALDLSEDEPPRSPGVSAETTIADQATFCGRWRDSDLWKGCQSLSSAATMFAERKRALVIDYDFPAPDRDSGSLRMVSLLQLIQALDYEVTLATMSLKPRPGYVTALQRDGIRCLYRPYVSSLLGHLREQGHRYNTVMLCRMETANALMSAVRQHCPTATIIFDTVDLHFLRLARQAQLGRSRRLRALAERAKRTELATIAMADHTFVVSEAERNLVTQLSPRSPVSLVSNIHHIAKDRPPHAARADILFVGGFSHPPNLDAVLFFAQQILPRLRESDPSIHCLIVGADPPPRIRALRVEQLHILGHQPILEPLLRRCRLSIAPLRFGAGVKGKIHQSLAYGLPVVATSIAAEGMHLQNGQSVLIADDPDAFAAAILRLYHDPQLWQHLSDNGVSVIQDHFSVAAAMKNLRPLLAD